MCVVIKKLTHPYSLTHKNYNKNGWSIFCVWVSYGFGWISKGIFPEHSYYFLIFLTFFLSISLFSLPISSYFSPWFFSKIGGGGGIYKNEENGRLALVYQDTLVLAAHGKKRLALVYPDTLMLASHFCHLISLFRLFLIFVLIFTLLFKGHSKLCFLQSLYALKALDF